MRWSLFLGSCLNPEKIGQGRVEIEKEKMKANDAMYGS